MARRTVRPGDAAAHGAGLWAPHVGATSGESRGEDKQGGAWTLAAPSDSSSPDTVLTAWASGAGRRPGPPGHFAQKGHGQTHRDLKLGWKESQHQDRDAGWLLSELGTFDRQFQSWQGPATVLFSLAGRHVGDSSLRVNS